MFGETAPVVLTYRNQLLTGFIEQRAPAQYAGADKENSYRQKTDSQREQPHPDPFLQKNQKVDGEPGKKEGHSQREQVPQEQIDCQKDAGLLKIFFSLLCHP